MTTISNWAGYSVTAPNVTYSDVNGTWVVPTVKCTAAGAETYSSLWVGIGGYGTDSASLEQIGTDANCDASGNATYTAWYELVPAPAVNLKAFVVSPGDIVAAHVHVAGTRVTLEITDQTTGAAFARTLRMASPDVSSAEWIAEAPAQCDSASNLQTCSALPLANFGKATFTNATATSAGVTGSITDSRWTVYPTRIAAGGVISATPRAISADGSSFAVAWKATVLQQPTPRGWGQGQPIPYPGSGYGGGYGYGYGGGY
jgi:hypothetical protein